MNNHRVSLQFRRLSDSELIVFASNVVMSLTDNPHFPAPIVPVAELSALQQAFADALAASDAGGIHATAVKNDCRAALIAALRREASYVQSVAAHDLTKMLGSGYTAASQNRAQTPLPQPAIVNLLNERSCQLTLRVTPVANARNYQVQLQFAGSEWRDAGIYSQARRVEVPGLTPGTTYNLRVRALGGSTGYSEWSNTTSAMSL